MDNKKIIQMIQSGEAKNLDSALAEIWDKIKPSKIGQNDYDKFRSYKRRYEQGKLGEKAVNSLLSFFGYSSETIYFKEKDIKTETPSVSNKMIVKDVSPEPREDEDLFS